MPARREQGRAGVLAQTMADVVFKPVESTDITVSPVQKEKLSFEQLCLRYGTLITRSQNESSSGIDNIYTVPSGKVFLLVSVQSSVCVFDIGSGGSILVYAGLSTEPSSLIGLLRIEVYPNRWQTNAGTTVENNASSASSISYSVPLRITEGRNVAMLCSLPTLGVASTQIAGYEIDARTFYENL